MVKKKLQTKMQRYLDTQRLMERLANELQALESDQELEKERAFESELDSLLKKYDLSPIEGANVLLAKDPAYRIVKASDQPKGKPRKRKALVIYRNPHTGETVSSRAGLRVRQLSEWAKEYGKETVQSWATAEESD